jgi:hypothetical protein
MPPEVEDLVMFIVDNFKNGVDKAVVSPEDGQGSLKQDWAQEVIEFINNEL